MKTMTIEQRVRSHGGTWIQRCRVRYLDTDLQYWAIDGSEWCVEVTPSILISWTCTRGLVKVYCIAAEYGRQLRLVQRGVSVRLPGTLDRSCLRLLNMFLLFDLIATNRCRLKWCHYKAALIDHQYLQATVLRCTSANFHEFFVHKQFPLFQARIGTL